MTEAFVRTEGGSNIGNRN